MEHEKVLTEAIQKWGGRMQTVVAIEELSELQKELCKYLRYGEMREEIPEEIADVKIMLAQLEIILDCAETVRQKRQEKLERLQERLAE